MSDSNQAYISKVHLKGYKSIKDLEIDLKPGLNIIIGPNGSGKTNFLEFLYKLIRRNFQKLSDFEGVIQTEIGKNYMWTIVKNGDKVTIEIKGKKIKSNILQNKLMVSGKVFINQIINDDVEEELEDDKILTINKLGSFYRHFALAVFIEHSYPELFGISKPAKIQFNIKSDKIEDVRAELQFAIDYYFINIINPNHLEKIENPRDIVEINLKLIDVLKRFTPIENLRLNKDNFIITNIDSNSSFSTDVTIDNIITEFKIFNNSRWLKWTELSDGTKRMFYIISKIFYESMPINCETILIEEPELGIHPDQLYKLMEFLKEQSKDKQIIITTHSPDVLNVIGQNELDGIIVTRYDEEKGTIMRKMDEEQMDAARRYMNAEGLWLSDYWVHSNLEDAVYEDK